MRIQVAIPTYSKNISEIIDLYNFLNLSTDALFCVQQSGSDYNRKIRIKENTVEIYFFKEKGVSKNRNNLIRYATGDIIINTDDDCPLVDGYDSIVLNSYNKHKDAVAIYFNGLWSTHGNKPITTKKSRYIKNYSDISFAGGPGLTYKRKEMSKFNLFYDEKIGYPNYICAGEDSVFYYNMIKSKIRFYRENTILFSVAIDETNSTYNKGINPQYLITRGYVTKLLHPYLYKLYLIRHWIRFCKNDSKLSNHLILKLLIKGTKLKYENVSRKV